MAKLSEHPETASLNLLGYELTYHKLGLAGGPVFVLIPGIGVSHRYFVPLARELSQAGRVYMLDMPGFGRTEKPETSLSISEYGSILLEFLRYMKINQPVLIGHSMGCQIATDMLVRNPDITDELVLLGPTVNPRERHGLVQAMRLFQDGLHEPFSLNRIVVSDYLRCGPRWYFKVLPQMINDRIEDRLGRIRARTVVVRGQHDVIVPRHWTERVAEKIPDSTMHEIPSVGHVCMYKYPKIVADACLGLLEA